MTVHSSSLTKTKWTQETLLQAAQTKNLTPEQFLEGMLELNKTLLPKDSEAEECMVSDDDMLDVHPDESEENALAETEPIPATPITPADPVLSIEPTEPLNLSTKQIPSLMELVVEPTSNMKADSKEGPANESRAPPKAATVLGPSLEAQLQSFTATMATQLATATSAVTSMVADVHGLVERLGEKKTTKEEEKSHTFLLLENQALRWSIWDITNEQKSLGTLATSAASSLFSTVPQKHSRMPCSPPYQL